MRFVVFTDAEGQKIHGALQILLLENVCDADLIAALAGRGIEGLSGGEHDGVAAIFKLLQQPELEFLRVVDRQRGAFYLMAALPVDDADKFQQWLLEEFSDNGETVMMAPGGSMYATPGKGKNEVRMAYVLESDKLERAMDILKKAIEVYNAK